MFEFPAKKYHIFLIETWKREIIYTINIYIRAQKVLKPIHKQIREKRENKQRERNPTKKN